MLYVLCFLFLRVEGRFCLVLFLFCVNIGIIKGYFVKLLLCLQFSGSWKSIKWGRLQK